MDNRGHMLNENYLISDLEYKVRNNQFKSKEELRQYIVNLRNQGSMGDVLNNKKIDELLSLFDELNKTDEIPLDMNRYASVGLENKNLIVSKETDQILQTYGSKDDLSSEFKSVQNEIIANNPDGLTNADMVFAHMANYQKEEISLISLVDAVNKDNVNTEILSKIRFFITNSHINPYSYKVDVSEGIFYNIETNEVYEVRKNENTNQYEIYKGSELVYGSGLNQEENDMSKEVERNEEEMVYEQNLDKPKVRTLKKPMNNYNNAAFTKITFLVTNIVTFIAMLMMMYFLNK